MDIFKLLSTITDNQQSLHFVVPGIILASTFMVNLLVKSLARSNYQQPIIFYSALLGLSLAFYFSMQLKVADPIQTGVFLFNHLLRLDVWNSSIHQLLFLLTAIILLMGTPNSSLPATKASLHESMILGGAFGAYLLVMANHWLIIYSSMAIMSVCACVLIYASSMDAKGIIASFTYMLYQALVSSIMLWGMAYLYGTGSLFLHASCGIDSPLGCIGWCLAIGPIFLQMGIFPFHFWIPPIYKQASPEVIAYLATIPKLASLTIVTKLWQVYINSTNTPYNTILQNLLISLAIITLLIGHIGALRQQHPRDILSYGSIPQGGWLLASMLAHTNYIPALSYYSCIYGIMTLAAWRGLQLLHFPMAHGNLETYSGLGWEKPFMSIGLCVALLTCIGLPPTAGFTANLLVLAGLWARAHDSQNYLLLLLWLICLLGSLFSLYYYLKIPYTLFFNPRKQPSARLPEPHQLQYFSFFLLLALVLGLFFFSKYLFNLLPLIPSM